MFNRRGEWGDKGVFDSWFKSCWFFINIFAVILGRLGCFIIGGWVVWIGGILGGGIVGVGRVVGIEWSGSFGGLEIMGFFKRKYIIVVWFFLVVFIKMLELFYGIMKKKCDIFLYINLVYMY